MSGATRVSPPRGKPTRPPASLQTRVARALQVLRFAALVAGLALVAAFVSWPMISVVETGRTPSYPNLRPRVYHAPPAAVGNAAQRAVESLAQWTLVGREPGAVRAERRTRVLGFVDDVVVTIREVAAGTRISVRSAARVGEFDFGQNARNIAAFLAALDGELPDVGCEEER